MDGVEERSGADDGGPVLIVVEDGDVDFGLQAALEFEALGGLELEEILTRAKNTISY